MTRRGDDWSGLFPGVQALQAAGSSFAFRYMAYDHPRGIQLFEEQALTSAGFDLGSYYEEGPSSIMGGFSFGQRAAQAHLQILRTLGHPVAVPLFIACDFDITQPQMGPVYDALDGVASVIGRQNTGVYGGVLPVHLARANGKATYAVQGAAWDYRAGEVGSSPISPYANVYQGLPVYVGGTQCDPLVSFTADFGQWRRLAPPVPPPSQVWVPDHPGYPWDPDVFKAEPVLRPTDPLNPPRDAVGRIQFLINLAFGKPILKVDGQYGPSTQEQVQVWQYLAKVYDGAPAVCGPKTWASFGQYDSRIHRFDNEPILRFNDVGHPNAVRDLQNALNMSVVPGKTPIAVDGSFGPKTRDAVAQYQRNRRLQVNAEADRPTWLDAARLLTQRGR